MAQRLSRSGTRGSGLAKGASHMDVIRTDAPRRRSRLMIAGIVAVVIVATIAIARLRPAAFAVERASIVTDTVRRGEMTREVRGSGVLTPVDVRWIAATTDARVERIVVQPGTAVKADTVLIELSDPQQQQAGRDAEWQLRAAEADYETTRAQLENEKLDREAAVARLRSEREQARLRAEADAELERQGLAAKITSRISETTADELTRRLALEQQRLTVTQASQRSRLAAQRAAVEQRRAMFDLQQERTRSLAVRAGIDGVLQQINVQAGQRITAGTNIARVARPEQLKAEIRIAESQAKDIAAGQRAKVDTHNGIIDAHVSRIDPSVREGTVTVDLMLDGPLPAGARPDLTVDAGIELDRIADAVFVARPVSARERTRGTLWKVTGGNAVKVDVEFGRASTTAIEIRSGVRAGDEVIVSDTSAFDDQRRIKLQ
jgi:HlyD family secretion protein